VRWAAVLAAALATGAVRAETLRVSLKWKEVPTAQGYELQIARDAAFIDVVLQTRTSVAGYRWEQLPSQTHWWRVRTFDAEGRPSEWSAARTLVVGVAVPEPKAPADKAALSCGPDVVLVVEPGPLLSEYVVELSRTTDFSQPKVLREKGTVLSAGRLVPGRWYWRTQGVDKSGRSSEVGPVQSFLVRLGVPSVRASPEVPLGGEVQLSWAEVPCAASYAVEANGEGGQKLNGTSPRPAAALKPKGAGDFKVKVAAVDESGAAGDWSIEVPFKAVLSAPRPLSERAGPEVELSWAQSPGAAAYRLELARGVEFSAPTVSARVAATRWSSAELEPGRYRWRVLAMDAAGHTSAPSEPRSFEVVATATMPAPSLLTPNPDEVLAASAPVHLTWTPAEGATSYDLELDGELLAPVAGVETTLNALRVALHTVRVRANGKHAHQSAWTVAREFFVGPPQPARAEVQVRSGQVVVRLFDVRNRPLRAPAPSLAVERGRLGPVQPGDQGWRADWEPPSSGPDVLTLTAGDFHLEAPLARPTSSSWSLSARGGGMFSGGAVASPTGTLSVLHRLRPLQGRLSLEVRAGVYAASSSLALGSLKLGASAWMLPLSLLLGWTQDLGPVALRGGVGPSLQVAALTVGADHEWTTAPGVEVALALGRALGPGVLEVEGFFRWGRVDSTLARLNAGGVGLQVGYVFGVGTH
jgi:hypothetical protein